MNFVAKLKEALEKIKTFLASLFGKIKSLLGKAKTALTEGDALGMVIFVLVVIWGFVALKYLLS
jgi:hypothetical protein